MEASIEGIFAKSLAVRPFNLQLQNLITGF